MNIGQGDSEFIETPEGHYILIDGGPDSSVLQKLNSILPFWDRTIDVVILTHPDSDHMTGILDVFKTYNVDYFLWNGIKKDDKGNRQLAQDLLASVSKKHPAKVLHIHAGQEIRDGAVKISTLYPLQDLSGQIYDKSKNDNDSGIVNKLIYGKSSFLFTADIDSNGEKDIVDAGENVQADVLKVAHHGSKYSSSDLFLSKVMPKYAVIEVGKNSYGHPTPEALKRLENFGIQIKRTDKDGDVEFLSDGNNIKIQ